jgi:hypothetical protein
MPSYVLVSADFKLLRWVVCLISKPIEVVAEAYCRN